MRKRGLEDDLVDYFIAAFVWSIRDHEGFEQFWSGLLASDMPQERLIARLSSDGRALGLAVHEAVVQQAGSQVEYDVYKTMDGFVERYIDLTLNSGGRLPTAREVATIARTSVVLEE